MLIVIKSNNENVRVTRDGHLVIEIEGPPGDRQATIEVCDAPFNTSDHSLAALASEDTKDLVAWNRPGNSTKVYLETPAWMQESP